MILVERKSVCVCVEDGVGDDGVKLALSMFKVRFCTQCTLDVAQIGSLVSDGVGTWRHYGSRYHSRWPVLYWVYTAKPPVARGSFVDYFVKLGMYIRCVYRLSVNDWNTKLEETYLSIWIEQNFVYSELVRNWRKNNFFILNFYKTSHIMTEYLQPVNAYSS